jgi:hypothetical protein
LTATACQPPEETCNGHDDDCDDVADNGFDCIRNRLTSCTTTCGTIGQGTCTATCEKPEPSSCLPPVEICNGLDDNCNDLIDELFACIPDEEGPCETSCGSEGVGPCTDSCEPAPAAQCQPPAENCYDQVDNDCDGFEDCLDEDCFLDYACGP